MSASGRPDDAGVSARLDDAAFGEELPGVEVLFPGNAEGAGGVGGVFSDVAIVGAETGAIGADSTLVDTEVSALGAAMRSPDPGNACGRTPLDAHAAVVTVAITRLRNETRPDTRTILTGYRTDPRTTPAFSRVF